MIMNFVGLCVYDIISLIQNTECKCPYGKERKNVNNREVIICKPDAYVTILHQLA